MNSREIGDLVNVIVLMAKERLCKKTAPPFVPVSAELPPGSYASNLLLYNATASIISHVQDHHNYHACTP
uniref:Uncharacterized protein n=1 Tax=Arundo donax TaxID=35708 RepID=A0A0A9GRW0_ARUDO